MVHMSLHDKLGSRILIVLTPSVGISGYNSVKSGGRAFISQHNPEQFHG